MVDLIEGKETVYRESPHCFEVGTPNVSGVVGLVAAIDYITNLGLDAISAHKNELTALCISELEKLDVNCFGGNGIVTFMINNLHSHDIASLLDDSYICVRAGNMCAMPLLSSLDIASATRVSFGVYNSVEDVATFIAALKKILEVYCHE
jgi:cysteine desulfurase/selenocysteine lyase